MTYKNVNNIFPGPKSGFYIMRMNQCEVSDELWVAFILHVFEDTWATTVCQFLVGLKDLSRTKTHHVSTPTIVYLWAKYKEFWFSIMFHLFSILLGLKRVKIRIWGIEPTSLRYQPTHRSHLRVDRSSALCFNTNSYKPYIVWKLNNHDYS